MPIALAFIWGMFCSAAGLGLGAALLGSLLIAAGFIMTERAST